MRLVRRRGRAGDYLSSAKQSKNKMAAPGRGRAESKNVQVERDRRAQLEAGMREGDIPIRGRDGFGRLETRTIANSVSATRVQNVVGTRQVGIVANSRVKDLISLD
jgi:hypothetical protein